MRIRNVIVGGAAVTALALGGASIANAAGQGTVAPTGPTTQSTPADTDTLQSGDQTTPDDPNAAPEADEKTEAPESAGTEKAESPEAPGAETQESETGPSDGPGGHADPEGANVDHQFEGEE